MKKDLKKDIFISYRRNDGDVPAYLIFRDLSNDGYTVFYDHKTLGSGNFRENIVRNIANCNDVIFILSPSSFSEKIEDDNDVYRLEMETALTLKKHIVGIMLEEFPGFPDKLPVSIETIRYMNCLKLYMGYYEAMYSRLVSGMFLTSLPKGKNESLPSQIAINSSVPEELKPLSNLPPSERNACVQMLLSIMDSFNKSDICMRFYKYIDLYDRKKGVDDIPAYKGDIPTDLVTYLSFFETLYIIVASGSLNLSVIDFAYRFRFFAGCNNPTMQESELLPLGYQYPNIISFYNMWTNYVVDHFDHGKKIDDISFEIPMFEYDLHKRYASFCFANNPGTPVMIRFLNRNLIWLNLTMKTIDPDEIEACIDFQYKVLGTIEGNDENNFFEPLTEDEMKKALIRGACIGLYQERKMVAQMNLIIEPDDKEDLTLDLGIDFRKKSAAVFDYILVDQHVRGFAIQKTFLYVAECIAKINRKEGIIAVTSPRNIFSIKNFISQGFKIIDTLPKYRSIRHYLWKPVGYTDTNSCT